MNTFRVYILHVIGLIMSNFPRPCIYPNCKNVTTNGYCSEHESYRPVREPRKSKRRFYNSEWEKARIAFLMAHPFCAECKRNGRDTIATVVDHIQPHKGDLKLFWNQRNWQPLCTSCHNKKTAREDKGYWNVDDAIRKNGM